MFNNTIAIFDFESSAHPLSSSDGYCTEKTQFTAEHRPISFALANNINGNDDIKIHYSQREDDDEESVRFLVEEFYDVLLQWSAKAREEMFQKHSKFIRKVEDAVADEKRLLWQFERHEEEIEEERESIFYKVQKDDDDEERETRLEKALAQFKKSISRLTCVGYNSSGFDLPLITEYLWPLVASNGHEKPHLLKRNGKPIRLTVGNLTFVDLYTYLDPNCSLDSYLKAWSKDGDNVSTAGKAIIFPYKWMTETSKLLEK